MSNERYPDYRGETLTLHNVGLHHRAHRNTGTHWQAINTKNEMVMYARTLSELKRRLED